jgi:HD superfamily phosphodiesterase
MTSVDKAVLMMKGIFGSDERRINHALKVLEYSREILKGEKAEEALCEIVELTAIFHDIGIHEAMRKYNSNSGRYQEIEGPPIAEKALFELGTDRKTIDRICYIIGGHHTFSKNDGKDFQIIWEADLLVNIQEDGLDKKGIDLALLIDKNFRTKTGREIAAGLYLNPL